MKLSAITNQHGYDLMDPDGLRVSVKTITTSNHISLNEKTLHKVDRIIVVFLGTEADVLDVVIVYDKSVDEFVASSQPYQGQLRLSRSAMAFPNKPASAGVFDVGAVIDTHEEDRVIYRKHASGSYTVLVEGKPQPAFQHYVRLRNALGLSTKSQDTTRTLGAQVFGRLRSASGEGAS